MATHKFIIDVEQGVIDALDALETEVRLEGHIYKKNRDMWGTLGVNCAALARAIQKQIDETR